MTDWIPEALRLWLLPRLCPPQMGRRASPRAVCGLQSRVSLNPARGVCLGLSWGIGSPDNNYRELTLGLSVKNCLKLRSETNRGVTEFKVHHTFSKHVYEYMPVSHRDPERQK